MKYLKLLLISTFLLSINSCIKEDETPVKVDLDTENPREYAPEKIQEEYGKSRVVGFVFDKEGNPLDNVKVYFGVHESVTDGDGKFELTKVSEGKRKRIWFEKDGYAKTQKLIDVIEEVPNRVDAALFPISKTLKMTNEGGLIEGDNFSVEIQPGGFVYYDGVDVRGEVTISVTPFLTSQDNFIDAFPGDFEGRREDGSITAIESFGFIDVDLRDNNGEPVQLADGVTSTIKIKALQNALETIPMWYYDFRKAEWIEEGIGYLENGFYNAEVNHFTPWNWDEPLNLRTKIFGRVVDNLGTPLEGALITQTGVSFSYKNRTTSSRNGEFELLTMENSEVEIKARYEYFGSSIVKKTIPSEILELHEVGDIVINTQENNIEGPIIFGDTINITSNTSAIIIGEYFGNIKKAKYKLLLNNQEIETQVWQDDSIQFVVPNNIPEYGFVQIDRNGLKSNVIAYIEGDWSCEISGWKFHNDSLFTDEKGTTFLSFPNYGLTELPDCIGKLQKLNILNIESNLLIEIPESIGNLRNLTHFNLSKNLIEKLPESIRNLSENLEELNLIGNPITEEEKVKIESWLPNTNIIW
jgi:hypothetical protein